MRKRSTVRRRVVSAAGVVDSVVGLFANVAAAVLSGQSDDFASAAAAALRATNNRTLKPASARVAYSMQQAAVAASLCLTHAHTA